MLAVAGCNLGTVSPHSDKMLDHGARWADGTSVATLLKRALFFLGLSDSARAENGLAGLEILMLELAMAVRIAVMGYATRLKPRKNHTKNHKILLHWELIK